MGSQFSECWSVPLPVFELANNTGLSSRCHQTRQASPRRWRKSLWLLLTALWVGCAESTLPPHDPPSAIFRLAASGQEELPFSITAPRLESLGHQYLFVALPFGTIRATEPAADLRSAVFHTLANRGYRPRHVTEPPSPGGYVDVALEELQLSAYDALFFRIPYCRVKLRATLFDEHGSAVAKALHEASDYATRAMAFTQDLQPLYYGTLMQAVTGLLSELPL